MLFSDIRGFTSRSEGEDAENVVAHLNLYFKAMVNAIQKNHGMVDKFIGDGIMAMFAVPLDDPEAAYHAVQAAQAMLEGLDLVNRTLAVDGIAPIGIGVGIHTGEAVVGNIGSPKKNGLHRHRRCGEYRFSNRGADPKNWRAEIPDQ